MSVYHVMLPEKGGKCHGTGVTGRAWLLSQSWSQM